MLHQGECPYELVRSYMYESCPITHEWAVSHVSRSCHVWMGPAFLSVCGCVCLSVCHNHTRRLRQVAFWLEENKQECHMNGLCHLLMKHVTNILLMSHVYYSLHLDYSCHINITHCTYILLMSHIYYSCHMYITHCTYITHVT